MKNASATIAALLALVSFSVGMIEIYYVLIPINIPSVAEGTWEYNEIKQKIIGFAIIPILIMAVCSLLTSYFHSIYHKIDKKEKDTYNKESITGPVVLYLRSFFEGKTAKRRSSINDVRSEEEVMLEVMSEIAPVYAIVDPRDKEMPLGASRIVVYYEHWKQTVIDMANRADIVVLKLGEIHSFWWEVDTVLKYTPLNKVIIMATESKYFNNMVVLSKIFYDNRICFKQQYVNNKKISSGKNSCFIFFDKNGQAVISEVKYPRLKRIILSHEDIMRNALADFRKQYGFSLKPKWALNWRKVYQVTIIVSLLLAVLIKMFYNLYRLKYQMP